MLKIKNISITLSKGSKLEHSVLHCLNLNVAQGEFVVIIGGNGAGKSTLFNIISGSLKPDSGTVILDNKDITFLSQPSRAKDIALVMQDPRIGTLENMTILENMAFAFKRGQKRGFKPFAGSARRQFLRDRLAVLNLGLETRLDEQVRNLSGGQRQSLSLVMAVLTESKILLLDEICAALDPKTGKNVVQLAHRIIREKNRTCLMITHNMAHALQYGDRILVLKNGRFVQEYGPQEKQKLTPTVLALAFEETD